jgi:hypothetical protein
VLEKYGGGASLVTLDMAASAEKAAYQRRQQIFQGWKTMRQQAADAPGQARRRLLPIGCPFDKLVEGMLQPEMKLLP